MFLDAATFFRASKNWTLREAKAAWSAAYETGSERLLWQTLVDMSLVYSVEEDECIKVHEQLQSLGQRIACETSLNGFGIRVWDGNVGKKLLQSINEFDGKEIHCLRVGSGGPIDIPIPSFPKLEKLQFLEAHSFINIIEGRKTIHFKETAKKISKKRIESIGGAKKKVMRSVATELVLLHCVGSYLFDPALQTRLAVLKVRNLRDLPPSIGQLSGLKHLEIVDCGAWTLPNSLGQLKALQRLTLSFCEQLESLPESFGQLTALNYLAFCGCSSLCTLPESFGQLKALHQLKFKDCSGLESLPERFGELNTLNRLDFLECASLRTLPESFGQLKTLHRLTFSSCHELESLPERFGELAALNRLDFWRCLSLYTLPETFGQLNALNRLEFGCCYSLHTLPETFGQLKTLQCLKFGFCPGLEQLPESFGELNELNDLEILGCPSLHTLPEPLGHLTKLQRLAISDNIESWLNSLGDCRSLYHLKIRYNSGTSIPDCIKRLPSLQKLTLEFQTHLVEPLPPWLITPNVPSNILHCSRVVFQVQDGCFSFLESESWLPTGRQDDWASGPYRWTFM